MATKPCMIRVVVRENDDNGDGEPIHDRTGDHNYGDFREWISHTTYWAMRNGKRMSMYSNAT